MDGSGIHLLWTFAVRKGHFLEHGQRAVKSNSTAMASGRTSPPRVWRTCLQVKQHRSSRWRASSVLSDEGERVPRTERPVRSPSVFLLVGSTRKRHGMVGIWAGKFINAWRHVNACKLGSLRRAFDRSASFNSLWLPIVFGDALSFGHSQPRGNQPAPDYVGRIDSDEVGAFRRKMPLSRCPLASLVDHHNNGRL